ncbi:MAG: hypothetical protein WDM84_04895 [Bauldia sp.]
MAERLYLGVDAGGSNSRARIRDAAGRLLGEATAGGWQRAPRRCRLPRDHEGVPGGGRRGGLA